MYLLYTKQITPEMALTLISAGGALIVAKDHPFKDKP
jgi:hypothetical protein